MTSLRSIPLSILVLPLIRGVDASAYSERLSTFWWSTYGGAGYEECTGVTLCSDGGFALVGFSDSWTSMTDMYLVRTDSTGKEIWSRLIGGNRHDEGWAVLETPDGGLLVAGSTYSTGSGAGDAWLVKTDQTGVVEWARTYGTPLDEVFYSINTVSDGCFIASGMTGDYPYDCSMYLVKVDCLGNVLWQRTFGGGADDCAFYAMETPDGGFIIAGKNASSSSGPADGWILKTDCLGEFEWDLIIGDVEYDRFNCATMTPTGELVAAGYSFSTATGYCDLWLVGIDPTGEQNWCNTFGGPYANESADWIGVSTEGGCIAVGTNGSESWPNSDLWLLEVDAAGEFVSEDFFSGPGTDFGSWAAGLSGNRIAAGGATESFGAGGFDFLLVEFAPPFGTEDDSPELPLSISISTQPNPSDGLFYLELEIPVQTSIRIDLYDMSGRLVTNIYDGLLASGPTQLVVCDSDLSSGVYIIRLTSDRYATTRMITILP